VSGTLLFYPTGQMPDERPREEITTAVGQGTYAAMVWRPEQHLQVGTTYVAQVDVTSPPQNLNWTFDVTDSRSGELAAASLGELTLTAQEAWGGDRRCCEVDGMSCGVYTTCWHEDRVYLPTVSATVQAAPESVSPVLRRVRRGDGTVVSATVVGDPGEDWAFAALFEVDDDGPYCVQIETTDLATGDAVVGTEHCIEASEMQPYEAREETQPEPEFCDSSSYQDNDSDGEPDSGPDDDGSGDGDSDGEDGRGFDSGTTGEGCGCASSSGGARGTVSTVAVWIPALLLISYRRRTRRR
jgi:hypothetical protein